METNSDGLYVVVSFLHAEGETCEKIYRTKEDAINASLTDKDFHGDVVDTYGPGNFGQRINAFPHVSTRNLR